MLCRDIFGQYQPHWLRYGDQEMGTHMQIICMNVA